MPQPKLRPLRFLRRSYEELVSFPESVQSRAGFQLKLVQQGDLPDDWKPMATVGPGVLELRIQDHSGAYRVIYLARFEEAVYVLHCFEKKSQKTNRRDIDVASVRYRELVADRRTRD